MRGLLLAGALLPLLCGAQVARISYGPSVPEVRFAASELRNALAARGFTVVESDAELPADATFVIRIDQRGTPQSYSIRRDGNTCTVRGADAAGAMYGGLDLAESVRLGTLDAITAASHSPRIARRGIKFNIPLDLRTPSYSDCGDAGQQNIPEMWSFDFWREFLDDLARHRFNVLTLWSLHPFPSMVRVPEYPQVALDDVRRTTLKLDDTFSFTGSDMVRPAMLEHAETVRKMTIGEKISFWRDVMQHAHDRGIEVYIFTWNIFTWGAEGFPPSQTDEKTLDYFRKSVRELVLTYPLLDGIGITSGEQMQERKDDYSKEKWLWRAYGEGIRDALKLQPGRQVRLIHRYHQTALQPILAEWKDYPGTFDLSYKYAVAHMYSSPAPPFAREALAELPRNLRMWMTVRNDDIHTFRWGDPAYAREFIRNLPGPDKLAGFYMGPDGYIWGREFISTEPEAPRELVIRKMWYSFLLWGRLSYEPDLPDALFESILAQHFPEAPARKLFDAFSAASKIIPQVTRFFWGDIDLKWFPEACLSHPRHRGFYTIRHFVAGESMPGAGVLNAREYRDRLLEQRPMNGVTPVEVSESLRANAAAALKLVAELRPAKTKELRLTLGDLEAQAHLGNYYAEKIAAAADLAVFDRNADPARRDAAVRRLELALEHWKRYAAVATAQYKPQLFNRVGFVDLNALAAKVEQDIAIARDWQPGARK